MNREGFRNSNLIPFVRGTHSGSVLAPQKAQGAVPPKTWLRRLRGTGGRRANDISAKAGGRPTGLKNTRAEEMRSLLQRPTKC